MTWLTGTSYSVGNFTNYADSAGVGNGVGIPSYPDRIGDPWANIPTLPLPGYGPLNSNPGALAAPRGLTFGNLGRNNLQNPAFINFNMALYKTIQVAETVHFEFRTEAFNIFNHTEWGSPNAFMSCYGGTNNSAGDPGCVQNSNFLRITNAHPARVLQLGLKLVF